MKIVSTTRLDDDKKTFKIEVVDDRNRVQAEYIAVTTLDRSNKINEWKELFRTDDVRHIRMVGDKKKKFKPTKIPTVVYTTTNDIDAIFANNPQQLYDRILIAVEEGIRLNKKIVKLFELNHTDVFLTSKRLQWTSGLRQSLQYFNTSEQYEKSARCQEAINILIKEQTPVPPVKAVKKAAPKKKIAKKATKSTPVKKAKKVAKKPVKKAKKSSAK